MSESSEENISIYGLDSAYFEDSCEEDGSVWREQLEISQLP